MLIDRWYKMDPETEFYIPTTASIRDGMVIFPANPRSRWNVSSHDFSPNDIEEARAVNRWCRVSELSRVGTSWGIITFRAVYEDGSSKARSMSLRHDHLVKIDSISKEDHKRLASHIGRRRMDAEALNNEIDRMLEHIRING